MSPSLQLAGSQYLVITMIILKASCDYDDYFQGTVLQTVIPVAYNPGTVSRVTTASLSTALQAGL